MPIFFGRAGSYQKPKNTSADQLVTFQEGAVVVPSKGRPKH